MPITAQLSRTALLDKLWARMNERGDFPLLSDAVRATMAAMKHDDLDITALVRVVLSDFALTQKVLRLANSAMYMAFGGNITTVTRALMVLGMDAVGHLVVGLKLVDHFHHSAPRRIAAKLELNRALLSGCIARKLTAHVDLRKGEEAVVCTLMRQVGKLLVVCYLDAEWDAIRRIAELDDGNDEDGEAACRTVLGVGFAEIGLEAASRWRLPELTRCGMMPYRPDDDAPRDVQWLRAVSHYSTDVAAVLTSASARERDARLASLAQRFQGVLGADPARLVEIAASVSREETSDTVMREIVELRASADKMARGASNPRACLEAGLADLRALPSEHVLGPVLALASESVLAGLAFTRVVMFVRRDDGVFAARLGFGPDVDAMLDMLRFDEAFEPDVFHLAISNSVGIFIENVRDPKMAKRLPTWYRAAFDDALAFVLLPVAACGTTAALLYGDWSHGQPARKITSVEMSELNALAKELGRFFHRAPADDA
ncbi:histidine kinase [Burkholderia singularis]|uniref:Histidine kinase n=1 Tax=Burkholderia singularis TaxID=1503053 RepID=A0A103E6S0_9BURK|nr:MULTISPECIES: HDOD domain-containing protein [Burkholderia]AOK30159.1 histidine kinase [Burkholderia sp. Bp7605]KVE29415.1 histidine kinase [Burkholderia singularis]